MASSNGRLPFEPEPVVPELPDAAARAFAVDPRHNVVLQASAGTGKTSVLVERYVNLLRAGVEPDAILAITFTRKAAAEMRERIVRKLRELAADGTLPRTQWQKLRTRLGEIAISTIDAFCLALLREFPLEADVDPGFDLADETQMPRLVSEALDISLRVCRAQARDDVHVALVFAQLGEFRVRRTLEQLLAQRLVAPQILNRFLARGPAALTLEETCERAARGVIEVFLRMPGGVDGFLADGPVTPAFHALGRDLRALQATVGRGECPEPARLRAILDEVQDLFLTKEKTPRLRASAKVTECANRAAWERHRDAVVRYAPDIKDVLAAFTRDLNVLLARGVRRIYAVTEQTFKRTLEAHAVLDFTEVLERAGDLLAQMDEFAQSRYRLESRYHHVLVDEFQDTNRAQWRLVQHLIRSWGEGFGLASTGPLLPTIFTVGDRKQSIYRFRGADVRVVGESTEAIRELRPEEDPCRSIAVSFRAVPELLAFVNDLCGAIQHQPRADAFSYHEADRFPLIEAAGAREALGLVMAPDATSCSEAVAGEIARLLEQGVAVRDRTTGVPRAVQPDDIAILFRQRAAHQLYEQALERRGIPAYVYKGLGFFESDEIVDLIVLLRFLAEPQSDLRAAAFLRSRFVRLSDAGLGRLAPGIARALTGTLRDELRERLDPVDRQALDLARRSVREWTALADRITPAELLDLVIEESAYAHELRGPRWPQARENVKKFRALVRRVQNRGYATLARVAAHLETLSLGDESNAAIDAVGAVNLMTVHASKGLEFPIVFVVNLAKGAGGFASGLEILDDNGRGEPMVSVANLDEAAREEVKARDLEETKRLLYVAVTRARDRLYLAASRRGKEKMTWGSGGLGAVLPSDVQRLFSDAETAAAEGAGDIRWTPSGTRWSHRFLICPVPDLQAAAPFPVAAGAETVAAPFDPAVVADHQSTVRMPVTTWLTVAQARTSEGQPTGRRYQTDASYRVVGTLVHRLLQASRREEATAPVGVDELRRRAESLLRPEEKVELDAFDQMIDRAIEIFMTLRERPELLAAPADGERFDEVPFSYRVSPLAIVRGAIDQLVSTGGQVSVFELKTGGRKPEHQQQLDLYLEAMRARDPAATVDGHVIYPGT
ncbi:MAG TPA: UvrD-helicase domain-containing protein [Vicinamibacterales bacterium]|nr:UvrD-helicase domain-containing protein [Vicinamibacterales bacterium]